MPSAAVPPRCAASAALAPALARLRRGGDPVCAALEALLRGTGAALSCWTPSAERGEDLRWARRAAGGRVESGDARRAPRELAGLARGVPARARRDPRGRHALVAGAVDGPRLVVLASRPLPLSDGEVLELLRTLEELSELRAAWRGAARDARLAELGAASAGAAHDLRHRLTLAALELEHACADAPRRARELGPLKRLLTDARAACGALLGEAHATTRPQPLRRLLEREARAALRLVGEERGADLRLRCPRSLAFEGPQEPLERLARNLVLNALHATPRGGSVRVTAGATSDDALRLEVRDEGRGMSARELARAMQPGSSDGGGAGFGSESVRRCVERLGGRLELRSARGVGTLARVRLPARAATTAPVPSATA